MDKQQQIIQMFDTISPTYDRLNHLLSLGVDHMWRKAAAKKTLADYGTPERIVDVACGTGDMLLAWKKQAEAAGMSRVEYIGVEPAEGMRVIAAQKVPFATFHNGVATELPLEDNSAVFIRPTIAMTCILNDRDSRRST